ncbi:hypothetical protein [Bacillus cereus]|uniref:hypothetical protein n=1 Tax=Bacillus cereus TaxID=1396 RepID=UPI0018F6E392|nr:hypothetical protein [Bacillus cereus]MBJ7984770.1 hypothetical protein [Bacillus cereus]
MEYVSIQIVLMEDESYTVEAYKVFDYGRELKETSEHATEEEAIKAYQLKHAHYFGKDSPYWIKPPNIPINLNL